MALPAQFLHQPRRRLRTRSDTDQVGGLADQLRDLGEKSNAWVWKVTLSFTSVPDFFMMPGSTASPITFEITSSVA